MKTVLILTAGALAITGCHKGAAPVASNDNTANITALDEGNLTEGTNITDVPADDGDAPSDVETNAK